MKIKDLKTNKRNPRKISDKKLENLKRSIEKFGDLGCIVYNERTKQIVGGHQRAKVLPPNATIKAERLSKPSNTGTIAEGYVEVDGERYKYRAVDWNEQMEAEALIAANKHSGEWDQDRLKSLVADFPTIDIEITGFELQDFPSLSLAAEPSEAESDEAYAERTSDLGEERIATVAEELSVGGGLLDEIEEIAEEVEERVKLGDIWILGSHRLVCADSTKRENVNALIGDEKVDLLFIDPPYGLANRWTGGTWGANEMYADAKKWDQPLEQKDIDWYIKLAPKAIIWGGNYYKMPASRCWLAWDKTQKMETMADFELAWTNLDAVAKSWSGARNADGKRVHPTQKPVALLEWAIGRAGESKIVLDLFGGSGSTLMACERSEKSCLMMEISPKYCSTIIARWEKYTGKLAHIL